MPPAADKTSFKGPPGTCDCHMHVFGDPVRYPYSVARRNSPPADALEKFLGNYRSLARSLGIERMVFVQPSAYGGDNAGMFDAMQALGASVRGIVDIDENTRETELARLHQAGVRGVRINAGPPNRPADPALMAKVVPQMTRMDAICAGIGWQLDLLGPYLLYEEMQDTLKGLRSNFTVAHFGMWRGQSGAGSRHLGQRLPVSLACRSRERRGPLQSDSGVGARRRGTQAAPRRQPATAVRLLMQQISSRAGARSSGKPISGLSRKHPRPFMAGRGVCLIWRKIRHQASGGKGQRRERGPGGCPHRGPDGALQPRREHGNDVYRRQLDAGDEKSLAVVARDLSDFSSTCSAVMFPSSVGFFVLKLPHPATVTPAAARNEISISFFQSI